MLALTASLCAAEPPVTLRVSSSTVPPGGTAQIRVSLDSPRAVAVGSFSMDFDPSFFGDISDVQVFSAAGDVLGVTTIKGRHLDANFSSPSGGVGRLVGLPVIAVHVPVLSNVAAGASSNVGISPADSSWKDRDGEVFATSVEAGKVTAGAGLTIQNVTPGGGLQPSGSVIRIEGSGFQANTKIEITGVAVASKAFVSSSEIDVTLAAPAELTGKIIRASQPDGAAVEYVSSLRGTYLSSDDQSQGRLQPFFPLRSYSSINGGTQPSGLGGLRGIGLQNQNSVPVDVRVELLNLFGGIAGRKTVTLPPGAIYTASSFLSLGAEIHGSVGFLPSLPIRAVILTSMPIASSSTSASEVSEGYTGARQLEHPFSVSPSQLDLSYQTGSALPDAQSIGIYPETGLGAEEHVGFSVSTSTSDGSGWLSVTPSQGTVDVSHIPNLTVKVDPSHLAPGSYSGVITVTPDSPGSKPSTTAVSLFVSAQPYLRIESITNNSFELTPGSPSPQPQSFRVVSNGAPANISIAASTDSGGSWLTVAQSSVTTPATVGFSVNSSKLGLGQYRGKITVQGPANSVSFFVEVDIAEPLKRNPQSLYPSALTVSLQAGQSSGTGPYFVSVSPPGVEFTVTATTASGGSWLKAIRSSVGAGGVEVSIDSAALTPGRYSGSVQVSSLDGSVVLPLPVNLTVWAGSTPPLTGIPSTISLTGKSDTGVSQSFTVESGGLPLPVRFSASIPSNVCSVWSQSNEFLTQPLTPLNATITCSGPPGEYRGTITITAGTQAVTVPVSVRLAAGGYHGIATPPVVGSVVNAASGSLLAIAPGEILSIHGVGVGNQDPVGVTLDSQGNIARSVGGVRVLFDGMPAPILYASIFQTNVIVPYEIADLQSTSLQVEVNGVKSDAIVVPVVAAAPSLFTLNASGTGAAAVLNQDSSVNTAANPAAKGSVIQIFGTGEGQTTPAGAAVVVTHGNPRIPVLPVRVTIGGMDAQLLYAGSAPEAVSGLLQVNAIVPASVQAGSAVPITITVGEAQSQSGVTIAIK